jgi:AmmeMemoRadiSam system protein A
MPCPIAATHNAVMSEKTSTQVQTQQLLAIARRSLEQFVRYGQEPDVDMTSLLAPLRQPASSFVTLRKRGTLRGCIGSTHAQWPLAYDVARNAMAASRDPRFPPVSPLELFEIRIEISILSPPRPLAYKNHADLLQKLRPDRDGVILAWGEQRALLLPQVWARVPEPERFLEILCHKGRIPPQQLLAEPPRVLVFTFDVVCCAEDGFDSE